MESVAVAVPELEAPVPVRVTFCGLPAALSARLRSPVCVPLALGVNFTVIAQELPAARELPHVLLSENSLLFVPLIEMLDMLSAALPELESVTVWVGAGLPMGSLAKVRLLGERDALAAPAPVPVRVTL